MAAAPVVIDNNDSPIPTNTPADKTPFHSVPGCESFRSSVTTTAALAVAPSPPPLQSESDSDAEPQPQSRPSPIHSKPSGKTMHYIVPRPFPPPALANVPVEYIVNQLHSLAPHYWSKPETSDCTIGTTSIVSLSLDVVIVTDHPSYYLFVSCSFERTLLYQDRAGL